MKKNKQDLVYFSKNRLNFKKKTIKLKILIERKFNSEFTEINSAISFIKLYRKNMNKIFKNKKILITGHTGFKGAWLTFWLKSLGAKICGVS